jgi:DNA-binding transcriptional LysR family regulator
MNEIRAITVFLRAAALGSFRKAAADQGIAPQAASQAVMQLEQQLGIRLFHRTTRRLSLTEEGASFLAAAKPAHDALLDALAGVRSAHSAIAGPLRVSAPQSLGVKVVWPAILQFRAQYPEVELDLQFDDKFSDWVAERVDVGFRGGIPPDGRLIARRLLPVQLLVCASPDYLAAHGTPKRIDDLLEHACTGYRQANTGRVAPWVFQVDKETVYRDIAAVFCSSDPDVETEAVVAGIGVGQLGSFTAVPLIRAGRLVPLLTRYVSDSQGLYICYARRTQMSLRSRTFIDFMVDRLENSPDWVLSRSELDAAMPSLKKGNRGARAA